MANLTNFNYMILLWILIVSNGILCNGKYFMINTGKNETSKDYMMAGGCQPARIYSRREINCWSNCFEWNVVVNTNLECREKVKRVHE